eukprot:gene24272-9873_t
MKLSAIILISLVATVCGLYRPVDDKGDKLPFSTGSIVNVAVSYPSTRGTCGARLLETVKKTLSLNLVEGLPQAEHLVRALVNVSVKSKWLSLTCDVHEDKKYRDGSGCLQAGDDVDRHHKKAPVFLKSTVFCDKSLDPADDKDDCGGQGGKGGKGGGDCMGFWDCASKTVKNSLDKVMHPFQEIFTSQPRSLRGIHTTEPAVQTPAETSDEVDLQLDSGWGMSGFLLLSSDFASPDIKEGAPVFLISQGAHKYCRVDPINKLAIVCDRKNCGSQGGGGHGDDGADCKFELTKAPAVLLLALNYPDGPPGGDDSKPKPMMIRSTKTGRYCAPDRNLHHSAPLTCNFKESELTHKQVLLFTTNNYYPPYKSVAKAAAPAA